jgi:acetyl esterase/lipase
MPSSKTAHEPTRAVVYKRIGDAALSLHVFEPPQHKPEEKRAAIVFFFGGGWRGGSPHQFYPHCAYLASRGMVAMAAEYRTESSHGTTPFACVADGKSAVRWIRREARSLGIDPDRIAAGGGSAGGHVAAATGTLTAFDEPDEDPAIRSKPDALVLFNPVFDNGPGGWGHERVQERWQAFSPLHNIAAGAPPTIVFLGSEDGVLPVATAERYQARMQAVGARCEVWVYPGQPHAFFNYREGNNPYYSATLFEADRFLASLGYLAGAPTLPPPAV